MDLEVWITARKLELRLELGYLPHKIYVVRVLSTDHLSDPKADEMTSLRRPTPRLRPRLMATTPRANISLPKNPMSNSALYSVSSYIWGLCRSRVLFRLAG